MKMTILIEQGYKHTAEVEFADKHPDVFASTLAAKIVDKLAVESDKEGQIEDFRADLNLQVGAQRDENNLHHLNVSLAGQLVIPEGVKLKEVSEQALTELLTSSSYDQFGFHNGLIDIEKVTSQAPILTKTSSTNKFADSCIGNGHYIQTPYGLKGTFPALIFAKEIDESLDKVLKSGEIPELRPDGKVHVTASSNFRQGKVTEYEVSVEDIYLSVAHSNPLPANFKEKLKLEILANLDNYHSKLASANWQINAGGDFSQYFVQADSGVSKVKDSVIINGGAHILGSDAVWGKGLFKASSTIIPYSFALARAVSEVTGSIHASVTGYAKYGQPEAEFRIANIDNYHSNQVESINKALEEVPKTRDEIRNVLGMPVSVDTYHTFNDIQRFHDDNKPWKQDNEELVHILKKRL